MEDKPLQKAKQIQVMAEPGKAVPKHVTQVSIAKANDNFILSLLFSMPNESVQMVERIVIDQKLADEMAQLLKRAKDAK